MTPTSSILFLHPGRLCWHPSTEDYPSKLKPLAGVFASHMTAQQHTTPPVDGNNSLTGILASLAS
ncbi:hypothetical protein AMATHDRAFT_70841 [Amanita thiersii Skay4041]|uniref:Uncharacterized protein n=1 Tax=Amanita thiersii Skay4041 TaxID=703135 RepID=A0A2A9N891_9AGAR|nr:hypothetical protein AMATHDRAFT_70841 [Amanita thiersii Skay4041]